MTKTQIEKAIASLDARMKGVAKERDKLDDAISEMQDVLEDCQEALDLLQDARDALSRLV